MRNRLGNFESGAVNGGKKPKRLSNSDIWRLTFGSLVPEQDTRAGFGTSIRSAEPVHVGSRGDHRRREFTTSKQDEQPMRQPMTWLPMTLPERLVRSLAMCPRLLPVLCCINVVTNDALAIEPKIEFNPQTCDQLNQHGVALNGMANLEGSRLAVSSNESTVTLTDNDQAGSGRFNLTTAPGQGTHIHHATTGKYFACNGSLSATPAEFCFHKVDYADPSKGYNLTCNPGKVSFLNTKKLDPSTKSGAISMEARSDWPGASWSVKVQGLVQEDPVLPCATVAGTAELLHQRGGNTWRLNARKATKALDVTMLPLETAVGARWYIKPYGGWGLSIQNAHAGGYLSCDGTTLADEPSPFCLTKDESNEPGRFDLRCHDAPAAGPLATPPTPATNAPNLFGVEPWSAMGEDPSGEVAGCHFSSEQVGEWVVDYHGVQDTLTLNASAGYGEPIGTSVYSDATHSNSTVICAEPTDATWPGAVRLLFKREQASQPDYHLNFAPDLDNRGYLPAQYDPGFLPPGSNDDKIWYFQRVD